MDQWGRFFIEGGKKLGLTFTVIEDEIQKKEMEKAGFVDIHEFEYKVNPKYTLEKRTFTYNIHSVLLVDGQKTQY